MRSRRHWLPFALIYLRLFLIVPIVLILILQLNEFWLFVCLFVGLLSDVFDGIVARRIGVATTKLRRADTIVDSLFFTALLIAAWITHPELFQKYIVGLVILIGLKVVRMVFEYLKFRRETAYHMWSTKAWGISIFLAMTLLWLGVQTEFFFVLAIVIGIVTNLEGFVTSIILPTWHHDVPSVVHAVRLREGGVD